MRIRVVEMSHQEARGLITPTMCHPTYQTRELPCCRAYMITLMGGWACSALEEREGDAGWNVS